MQLYYLQFYSEYIYKGLRITFSPFRNPNSLLMRPNALLKSQNKMMFSVETNIDTDIDKYKKVSDLVKTCQVLLHCFHKV